MKPNNGVLPAFVDAPTPLAHCADSLAVARRRYVAFVEQGIRTPSPWERLRGQVLLGERAFLRKSPPIWACTTLP